MYVYYEDEYLLARPDEYYYEVRTYVYEVHYGGIPP